MPMGSTVNEPQLVAITTMRIKTRSSNDSHVSQQDWKQYTDTDFWL